MCRRTTAPTPGAPSRPAPARGIPLASLESVDPRRCTRAPASPPSPASTPGRMAASSRRRTWEMSRSCLRLELSHLHRQREAVGLRNHADESSSLGALDVAAHVAELVEPGERLDLPLVVQVRDEKVLGVLQQVGAEALDALGRVDDADVQLGALLGQSVVDVPQ